MNNKAWGWTQRQDYAEAWPSCGLAKELAEAAYMSVEAAGWNEIDLIVTIIIEAAKAKDFDFLHSKQFERYCEMIRIDNSVVLACIYKVGRFDVN